MKFKGSFFNPEYAGEGFAFDEGDDGEANAGIVILHFYSYKKGLQFWLFGVGHRSGNVAMVDCWEPVGGDLGDKAALKDVEEIPWGQIQLTDKGDRITVEFMPLDEVLWIYDVWPAHKLTAPPIIVPPPVPPPVEPPVEPPPVVEPTTKIIMEKWLSLGDKSKWVDMGPVPLHSSAPVYKSRIGNTSYMWTKNRITVIKGTLTISQVNVSGPDHPKMTGVAKGDVYHAGDPPFEIELYVGPATATTGWKQSNYGIWAQELGEFFRVSAQVMYEL